MAQGHDIDVTHLKNFCEVLQNLPHYDEKYLRTLSPLTIVSSFHFYKDTGVFPPKRHPNGREIFMDLLERERNRHKYIPHKRKTQQILTLHKDGYSPLQISIITHVKIALIEKLLAHESD